MNLFVLCQRISRMKLLYLYSEGGTYDLPGWNWSLAPHDAWRCVTLSDESFAAPARRAKLRLG